MNYREILNSQLKRRQELNPRFSLRSFALKLKISPSKLSEVLAGKKRLSVARLTEISNILGLKGVEKEVFLLSAEIESTRTKNKEDLSLKIKKLSQEIASEKTSQRNAWYFGAIKSILDSGNDLSKYQEELNLTALQIENGVRFLKRIKKNHPERNDITLEPISVIKKINESLESNESTIDADFVFLNQEEYKKLFLKIKTLIKKFKYERANSKEQSLQMVYFGMSAITKETK